MREAADGAARLGGLYLAVTLDGHGRIARIEFCEERPLVVPPEGNAAQQARTALEQWPSDPLAVAALPRAPAPTPFQARVREALLAIPPGQTRTYGALARQLGSSARAVGAACRANPLPLLVPCHRVVAADGLGGYAGERAGARARLKAWLLERERRLADGCRCAP
ncbi:MAG: methylated-DNA--[protein]-cysteine S-methyltransferase [Halorhodospira sp.]